MASLPASPDAIRDPVASVLDALPVPAAVVGADRRWRHANAAMSAYLGDPRARPGDLAADAVDAADRDRFHAQLADPAALPRTILRWHRPGGGVTATDTLCGTLRGARGDAIGWLVQLHEIRDVTLADALAARDTAQRELRMVADALAHDLRAPLRAIDSFAERLARTLSGVGDAAVADHLARIRGASTRMSDLVAALSRFARAQRTDLRPQDVDIGALVEWACMDLHARHPGRQVELDLQPRLRARGDERLLRLLVSELVDNAWRFTPADAPVRLSLRGEAVDGRLRLALRDRGSGFDMRYAHKLFQPFQRLHAPDAGGGHGLGLAIAHRIVEHHGGRVCADSVPGEGTTLHLELPAAPGEDPAP